MSISFKIIKPHILLKGYIEKIWLFESSGKIVNDDLKLIVPNGNLKLTVSFQNGIVASINNRLFTSKEQGITLSGLIDVPVYLDVEKDINTKTIGVEFSPFGAYRFFRINLNSLQNKIYSLDDVLDKPGKLLIEQINNTETIDQKIIVLQQFLLRQLAQQKKDLIFEYCVERITTSRGKITVKELEKKTGYSSRWLNMKFTERLGISPKNFASVIRFSQYYQLLINENSNTFCKNDFYELYYDQSHFIKDFKRFTGLPPTKYERMTNQLGESYFRD